MMIEGEVIGKENAKMIEVIVINAGRLADGEVKHGIKIKVTTKTNKKIEQNQKQRHVKHKYNIFLIEYLL